MDQVVLVPYLWGPCVCFLLDPYFVSLTCLQKKRFFSGFSSFLLHSPNLGFSAMPLGSAVDILATDDPNFSPDDQQDTQIYEKHDSLLHGVKKKK